MKVASGHQPAMEASFGGPYHSSQYPPYGWLKLELGMKLLAILLIFIGNYVHLAWTLKRPQGSWTWRITKLVLVFLMPSFACAEFIVSICQTIFLLLRIKPEEFKIEDVARDWRRYLCSLAGMYTAPDPEEEEGEEPGPAQDATAVRLSACQTGEDLRHHLQPWKALTVVRIVAVIILGIAPGPLSFLGSFYYYHDSLAGRYIVACVGNATCTIVALLALFSRSQWSMVHLTTSQPKQEPWYVFGIQLVIGALINEAISWQYWFWDIFPGYPLTFAIGNVLDILDMWPRPLVGPSLSIVIWIVLVALFLKYKERIVRETKINWDLVFGCLLVIACTWVVLDLVGLLAADIRDIINW